MPFRLIVQHWFNYWHRHCSSKVIQWFVFFLQAKLALQNDLVKPISPAFLSTTFCPTTVPSISLHTRPNTSIFQTASLPHSFLRAAPGPIRPTTGSILFAPYWASAHIRAVVSWTMPRYGYMPKCRSWNSGVFIKTLSSTVLTVTKPRKDVVFVRAFAFETLNINKKKCWTASWKTWIIMVFLFNSTIQLQTSTCLEALSETIPNLTVGQYVFSQWLDVVREPVMQFLACVLSCIV